MQNTIFCHTKTTPLMINIETGSRIEPEPEFYEPVLSYFCRTLTEPELYFSKLQRVNRN